MLSKKKSIFSKQKNIFICGFLVVAFIIAAVGFGAFFTDRVNRTLSVQVSSFDDDGYTIVKEAPEGYLIAGETVEVKLKETNSKDEDITSQITMTVSWDSPVANVYPWGNDTAGNAVIKLGNTEISYTVNDDKTITFTLPETFLAAGKTVENDLTFQIPSDLVSTGQLNFTFDEIVLAQSPNGWTIGYDHEKVNALDFSVGVAWNISANSGIAGSVNRDVIAILNDTDEDGTPELEIIKNGASNNTNKGAMMDWKAAGETPWADYNIEGVTFTDNQDGSGVTSIGDYAFAGETGITSVDIPDTITSIGTSAFDGSGLTGTLTLPASVKKIESLGFGNLPKVDTIVFGHDADDKLTLPDNEAEGGDKAGAFYVSDYVETTITTDSDNIQYEYNWVIDNRKPIPTLAKQNTWYSQGSPATANGTAIAVTSVTSVEMKDWYNPSRDSVIDSWDASEALDGSVMAFLEDDGLGNNPVTYKLTIAGNGYGKIYANEDSGATFGHYQVANAFSSMTSFIDTERVFDTSSVTTMNGMFNNCKALTSLDVSGWDTSMVKVLGQFVRNCSSLTTITGIGDWDTSLNESLYYTFAGCSKLTSLDISNWNTSNTTRMDGTFNSCSSLSSLVDLSTKTVGTGADAYTAWDTSKVTLMDGMFGGCSSLTSLKVDGWNTEKVTTMKSMFYGCSKLPTVDVSHFNTSEVTNVATMFQFCSALKSLDLTPHTVGTGADAYTAWDIGKVQNMSGMFYNCSKLTTIGDTSDWDTSSNKYFDITFYNCISLASLNTGTWDTSSVTNMNSMFAFCKALTELDVSTKTVGTGADAYTAWDTGKVQGMLQMFNECRNLSSLDLTGWKTGNVTTTASMFMYCTSLTSLDLSEWNTEKVTNMAGMFYGCSSVKTLNIAGFNTSNVTSMCATCISGSTAGAHIGMLGYMSSLEEITVGPDFSFVAYTADGTATYPHLSTQVAGFTGYWYNTTDWTKHTAAGLVTEHSGLVTYTAIPPALDSISITTAPDKVDYIAGEDFDPTGMVVQANYTHSKYPSFSRVLADTDYTISGGEDLTSDITKVTVSYTDTYYSTASNGVTKTADQPISVVHPIPTLAKQDTWFTQGGIGGTTIAKTSITSINIVDKVDSATVQAAGDNKWDASEALDGSVMAYLVDDGLGNNPVTYKLTIAGNGYGKIYANADSFGAFGGTADAKAFSAMTSFTDTERVFDTSNVTTMNGMFCNCKALTSLDVSGWDTGAVTTMETMFTDCQKLESLDLSGWNTSKVTTISCMFQRCKALKTIGDISTKTVGTGADAYTAWDTSSITSMSFAFFQCNNLESLDVSNWNTSKVTNLRATFQACSNLETLDVATKTVGTGADAYTAWDTSSVTNMHSMFGGCNSVTGLDVSKWNTSKVTNMQSTFNSCESLTELNVSTKTVGTGADAYTAWDTSSVTNMNSMFAGSSALESVDLSKWNTSKVTNMQNMFANCKSLTNLGNIDTHTVGTGTDAYTAWDTANVTTTDSMFFNCESLTSLDLSEWNTEKVTNMSGMVYGCSSVKTLNIAGFNTSNVTSMCDTCISGSTAVQHKGMLNMMSSLEEITVGPDFSFVAYTADGTATYPHLYTKIAGFTGYWYNTTDWTKHTAAGLVTEHSGLVTYTAIPPALDSISITTAPDKVDYIAGEDFDPTGMVVQANYTHSKYPSFSRVLADTDYTISGGEDLTSDITKVTVSYTDTYYSTASNGVTKTADQPISVTLAVPILAKQDTWYSQGNPGINKGNILSIEFRDTDAPSSYDKSWDASQGKSGTITAYAVANGTDNYDLILVGNGYGKIFANADCDSAFAFFSNLVSITGLVNDSDEAFFDTSNTTDMNYMFGGDYVLSTLDVSKFNTSKVTDFSSMFYNCKDLASISVDNFDVSSAIRVNQMFSGCESITTVNVSNWKVYNVQYMQHMFNSCDELVSLDLSKWNVGNVKQVNAMFQSCAKLTTIGDVSGWTFSSNLTDAGYMFSGCKNLQSVDVSNWNVSQVKYMNLMFNGCSTLTTLAVDNWNVGSATNMAQMFYRCTNLTSLNVSGWDPVSATDMSYMFARCSNLPSLAVDNWTVSSVTNMSAMFYQCYRLATLNVSAWDTSSVTSVTGTEASGNETWDQGIFEDCSDLEVIDISGWNMSGVTNTAHMFRGCDTLKSLIIPASLTVISPEFAFDCGRLTNITFMHSASDTLSMPAEAGYESSDRFTTAPGANGEYSDGGAFYVFSHYATDPLRTKVTAKNEAVLNYDWTTDYRGYTITAAPVEGGTLTTDLSVAINGKTITLTPAATSGYTYDGATASYTNESGAAQTIDLAADATTFTMPVGDVTLTPKWKENKVAFAVYSDTDGSFTFYYRTEVPEAGTDSFEGKAATAVYTGFDTETYTGGSKVPWKDNRANIKSVSFTSEFAQVKPVSTAYWFYMAENMTTFNPANLDTSNTTDMTYMFCECKSLSELDVSSFETGNVSSMFGMFYECSGLSSLNVSTMDTSSVTSMCYMFKGCTGLTNLTLGGKFDTSNVKYMSNMFEKCSSLTTLDLSAFSTACAEDLDYMFSYCSGLTGLDLTSFNTSNAVDMTAMFQYCTNLKTLNISTFTTPKVTSYRNMFYDCSNLTGLDLSGFTGSLVETMADMFGGCSSLTTLDVSSFNTAVTTNVGGMFFSCKSLSSLKFGSNFTTEKVTYMYTMFKECSSLTSLDLSMFNTSSATSLYDMFYGCTNLKTLTLSSNFVTSSCKNLSNMFYRCKALESLDLSSFTTASATNMSYMFAYCTSISTLDLSTFDTSSATNMSNMFSGMSKLQQITLGSNFSFAGNGTCTIEALPTPSSTYITGADGNWYTADGTAYTPYEVAEKHSTAATYYAYPIVSAANTAQSLMSGNNANAGNSVNNMYTISDDTKIIEGITV